MQRLFLGGNCPWTNILWITICVSWNTSNRTCALIYPFEEIISAIENNKFIIEVFIFINTPKTCDIPDHRILLSIVVWEICHQMDIYLSLWHSIHVKFQNSDSDILFIKLGVPQVSILGSPLFRVIIDDLHNVSSVLSYISFADDSNLLISIPNFKQVLKLWMISWKNYMLVRR